MSHRELIKTLDPTDKHMIVSHEGGAVYAADEHTKFMRFLIMGSHATFYASAKELTESAIAQAKAFITKDPISATTLLERVMSGNLAYRRDPSLLALSLVLRHPDVNIRRQGEAIARHNVKTGTDILHLASYLKMGGGWNTLTLRVLANFFLETHTPETLALQAVKYDQRDGWALRDLMRLTKKLRTTDPARDLVLGFIAHPDKRGAIDLGMVPDEGVKRIFSGWEIAREKKDDPAVVAESIRAFRTPREAIPGELLADKRIWEALYEDMPAQALIRNLGKLASLEIGTKGAEATNLAIRIHKAADKLHPMQFLLARKVYGQGQGAKGSLRWKPNDQIIHALDAAFENAFGHLEVNDTIEPLIALDVSASMDSPTQGTVLSCYEAEAATALVLQKQFPRAQFVAFSSIPGMFLMPTGKGAYAKLMQVLQTTPMGGGTDCRIPLSMIAQSGRFDAAITMTDNETGVGRGHTGIAHAYTRADIVTVGGLIREIRKMKPEFRHADVAFQLNDISIADPNDPLQMDFVGMSADLPQALGKFLSGQL